MAGYNRALADGEPPERAGAEMEMAPMERACAGRAELDDRMHERLARLLSGAQREALAARGIERSEFEATPSLRFDDQEIWKEWERERE